MDRSLAPAPSMTSLSTLTVAVLALLSATTTTTEAYAFGPASSRQVRFSPASVRRSGAGIRKKREDGSAVTLYLFPTPPSVSAANHQRSHQSAPSAARTVRRSETSLPAMSHSVLAESDILPSFHTAHGLLSPEVVMRIADANDLEQDGALHKFLMTYKRRGPMACLPMLSDPEILPELTKAMREIA